MSRTGERRNKSSPKAGTSKRAKLEDDTQELELNVKLEDDEVVQKLHRAWDKGLDFDDENGLRISGAPFRHVEVENFIKNKDFMESLSRNVSSDVTFYEKASDLLQFKQSDDLTSTKLSEVRSIRKTLETRALELMLKITDFPLNGQVDLFLSDYQQKDFLLCHDDQLEERRIAFILYLTLDWKEEYGGCLDLFESTEDVQPTVITKTITPSFNKFVFFTVNSKSFHQVAEVVAPDVRRLALSGWFYGEPIPRPKIIIPPLDSYQINVSGLTDVLDETLNEVYTDEANFSAINDQLVEDSEALLMDFIKPEMFGEICEGLNKIVWKIKGPANLQRFQVPVEMRLWPIETELSHPVNKLAAFFHSSDFLKMMEKITEYKFLEADSVSSSLEKYDHTCYSLLRPGEESEESKIEFDAESDSDSDTSEGNESETTLIDLIYYCGVFEWMEEWGGLRIYTDDEGEQLMTITPQSNSLAIVVRNSSVRSYVNYINCLSIGHSYFSYSMTFTFKDKS